MMIVCKGCNLEKDESEFNRHRLSPNGRDRKCKQCRKDYQKDYYSRNPSAHRLRVDEINRSRRGTPNEIGGASYEEKLASQGGGCAICGQIEPLRGRSRLHQDHSHSSGHQRGILCHSCNIGIGVFKDNPDLLLAAASYLEFWAETVS